MLDSDIKVFKNDIEKFAEWIFLHYTKENVRTGKVIHDGVWGTHRFETFEIELINTPLIQRLRQIHQTAQTFLTYPSAIHTRFEHTLGVTAQIRNLINALQDKFKTSGKKLGLLDDLLTRTLRISAILHDCGHGPLSHTSEEIYGNYPVMQTLKKQDPFKTAGPGEILSYFIINTKIFNRILRDIATDIDIDFELMKNAIVGFSDKPENNYKIDMIHGPFDADKIDYLFRDGHFSGLPLQIDLDRLYYAIDISNVKSSKRLTIDWGGISSVEQILFSKMTLFPSVYHHHKVRACDCMFKGIIEYIIENKISIKRKSKEEEIDINFLNPAHFLYFTDYDFFDWKLCEIDDNLHNLLHSLIYRRLLKRAIVISRDTIKPECKEKIDSYVKFVQEPVTVEGIDYYRWLAKEIWEEAGRPGLLQEIWVDCPKDPSFNEANNTWISPLGDGQDPIPLTEFFSIDKYADQYKQRKWRSHVFCKSEYVDKISKACVKVFREKYEIEFKQLAFQLCHVDSAMLN